MGSPRVACQAIWSLCFLRSNNLAPNNMPTTARRTGRPRPIKGAGTAASPISGSVEEPARDNDADREDDGHYSSECKSFRENPLIRKGFDNGPDEEDYERNCEEYEPDIGSRHLHTPQPAAAER
jgi:hypothetical protein